MHKKKYTRVVPWEQIVDIRKGERISDSILEVISGVFKFNMMLSMDPMAFERRTEYIEREEAKRKRLLLRKRVRESFRALERGSFIAAKNGVYSLTLKGWLRYAWNYSLKLRKLQRRNRKGKKVFIVIFDIPEKLRRFRESLRRTLYNLGFSQLQKSVFIGYDPKLFDFVAKIVAQTELHDRVKLIVGDQVL